MAKGTGGTAGRRSGCHVFICYRREGGEFLGKMIYDRLYQLGYGPFFDVETMRSGPFNTQLYQVIDECDDFLLLLSPGALDRCWNEGDWVMQEITYALSHGKNVIPLRMRGFEWPERLPEPLQGLPRLESLAATTEYFDAWIQRLGEKLLITKPRKKFLRRPVVLALAALAALALIGTGLLASRLLPGMGGPAPTPSPEPTAAPTAEPSPEPAAPAEEDYHILLAADADASISDMRSDVKLLRQRLDIFAGPDGYTLTQSDMELDLTIPRAAFGSSDPENILDCYLVRACRLYAFDRNLFLPLAADAVAIGQADIESLQARRGPIESLAEPEKYHFPESGDFDYLELTFTDQFVRENSQRLEAMGDGLAFAQDMAEFNDNYYYFYTAPAGDGKTFYLYLDEELDVCLDLAAFDLRNRPLTGSFRYMIEDWRPERSYHVLLAPPASSSMNSYASDLKLLQERLDLFCGRDDYFIHSDGTVVDLYVRKQGIGLDAFMKVLERHLTRANDLYIYDGGADHVPVDKCALAREDLEQVELLPVDLDDELSRIRITLTASCADRLADEIASWGDDLAFGLDMEQSASDWYGYPTEAEGDGRTFTIGVPTPCWFYAPLIERILTSEPYSASFRYEMTLDDTTWEQPAGQGLQCSPSQLEGDTVTALFLPSDELSDWEYRYAVDEIKNRLDAVGMPYAVGARDGQEHSIVVMTGLERMSEGLLNALCAREPDMHIRAGLMNLTTWLGREYPRNGDGACTAVVLRANGYNQADVDGFMAEAAAAGEDVVLYLGGDALLTCDTSGYGNDGALVFDRTWDGEPVEGACPWLPALLERLTSASLPGYALESYRFPSDSDATELDFGVSGAAAARARREVTDAVTDAVHSAVPEAEPTVSFGTGYGASRYVYVSLHLEPDDELPQKSISAVRAVYDAYDLADSPFDNMLFYLFDEDADTAERARLYFSKNRTSYPPSEYSQGLPPVSLGGIFANGRVTPFIGRFRELIEADTVLSGIEDSYGIEYLDDGFFTWGGKLDQ